MKTDHLRISLVSVAALALAACAQGPLCKSLGSCGGNPEGTWGSIDDPNNPPGCIDGPYFQPTNVTSPGSAFDDTLFNGPSPVAGQMLSQPRLSDWCGGIKLQKDSLKALGDGRVFVFQDPQITNFSVTYFPQTNTAMPEMSGEYTAGFKRSGRFGQWYSNNCLNQFGSDPTDCVGMTTKIMTDDVNGDYAGIACTSPGNNQYCGCSWTDKSNQQQQLSGMAMYCKAVGIIVNKEGTDETFKNVTCVPDPDPSYGGCDCAFDVAFPTGEVGYYKVDGNVITNYPENTSINYASKVTFCVHDNVLDLSGFGDSYLFNKAPVRTYHLVKQ